LLKVISTALEKYLDVTLIITHQLSQSGNAWRVVTPASLVKFQLIVYNSIIF